MQTYSYKTYIFIILLYIYNIINIVYFYMFINSIIILIKFK